jgi:serine/threonine protein kinase
LYTNLKVIRLLKKSMQRTSDPKRIPFEKLITSTSNFLTILGEGATGEVYQGTLDGIPIAVKRLKLVDADKISFRIELERRFYAELKVLRKFAHPRIVRILGFSVDDNKSSQHPFAIVLELLEGGSLSDWLKSPNDEAPKRTYRGGGSLSASDRLDIALGTASGLAYLHGFREEENGSDSVSSEGRSSLQELVLHRDVKSANIGLAIHRGESLYSKLLDCGLAKALKGNGVVTSSVGNSTSTNSTVSSTISIENAVSFTGGLVAGTVGYMSPELARGKYTVQSEIYAFGVVLLELLLGKRVGPDTAVNADEEAEDKGGVECIAIKADVIWPKDIAVSFATLILECIAHREKNRPVSMTVVIERLKKIRSALDKRMAEKDRQVLIMCTICMEECDEQIGAWCTGKEKKDHQLDQGLGVSVVRHFCCSGCLQGHVVSIAEDTAKMRASGGRIPCVSSGAGGCNALWNIADLGEKLEKATHVIFSQALVNSLFDAPRRKKELEDARIAAEAAVKEEGIRITEKVRRLRNIIVERDLTLHCPRCGQAFYDFQGCCALHCKNSCGAAFCGLCLTDCGDNAHNHFFTVHVDIDIFDVVAFETSRRKRCIANLIAAVKEVVEEKEVCKLLIEELGKADLDNLGYTMDELNREVMKEKPVEDKNKIEKAPEILPNDAVELVKLLKLESVKKDAKEVGRVSNALRNIAESESGRRSCIAAGASRALTDLAKEMAVKENGSAAGNVAGALLNIAESESGRQSCIAAGAPRALTELAKEKAVKENGTVAGRVAWALLNIAESESGRQSCIAAGTSFVLTELAKEKTVKENGTTAGNVAFALGKIAESESGCQSCIDAGAPLVLTQLAKEKTVKEDGTAAENVASALCNIAKSESGRQSCIVAGTSIVLTQLAKEKTVKENGSAAGNVASALKNIAESESGIQSCIAAGASRALTELAKEKAVKENGTVAGRVAWALLNIAESESGRQSCIAAGAPRALTELAKEKAVKENGTVAGRVAWALLNIAESESGRQSCIAAGAPLVLTELAKEKTVKENGTTAGNVAFALGKIAESESGCQSCIDAGAPLVLTQLAKEKTVKEDGTAAENVASALCNIAKSESGRQSCIVAGTSIVLTQLAKEKTVKENGSAAGNVASALKNIALSESGIQSCIAAGASRALTDLAKEMAVKENGTAAGNVAWALLNIAESESGRQSCIAAGAPRALTELAKEKAVKEKGLAAGNVAFALGKIALSESGRQSCIAAGTSFVLTELAKERIVKENGTAAANVAWALRNIAESESGRQSCIAAGAPRALTELAKEKAVKENGLAAQWVALALSKIA